MEKPGAFKVGNFVHACTQASDRGEKKTTLLMPLLERVYGGSLFFTDRERICASGGHYKCPDY